MAKLTQEVEYAVRVGARLEEDELSSLFVAVSFPYGEEGARTATSTVEDFPNDLKAKVAAVLMEVREHGEKQALTQARRAAAKAEEVAVDRKEME